MWRKREKKDVSAGCVRVLVSNLSGPYKVRDEESLCARGEDGDQNRGAADRLPQPHGDALGALSWEPTSQQTRSVPLRQGGRRSRQDRRWYCCPEAVSTHVSSLNSTDTQGGHPALVAGVWARPSGPQPRMDTPLGQQVRDQRLTFLRSRGCVRRAPCLLPEPGSLRVHPDPC